MRCNGPTRCRGPRRRRPVCAWTTGRGRGGPCLDVIFMPHGWPAGRHGTLSRKPRQLAFRCAEVTTACSRRGSIESNEGIDCCETALREVGPDLPGQAIVTGQQRHLFVRQPRRRPATSGWYSRGRDSPALVVAHASRGATPRARLCAVRAPSGRSRRLRRYRSRDSARDPRIRRALTDQRRGSRHDESRSRRL